MRYTSGRRKYIVLFAVAVLLIGTASAVDGFEDNDITDYSSSSGNLNDWSIQSNTVNEGNYALKGLYDGSTKDRIYTNTTDVQPGGEYNFSVYWDGSSDDRGGIYFGGYDENNNYLINFVFTSDGYGIFTQDGGGNYNRFSTGSGSYTSQAGWRRVHLDWDTNGDMEVNIYAPDGTLSVTLTGSSTKYGSADGGSGYRLAGGEMYYDTVDIDTEPPNISYTSETPADETYVYDELPIKTSASDSGSGINTYKIQVDGVNQSDSDGNITLNPTVSTHTFKVWVQDNAGNWNSTNQREVAFAYKPPNIEKTFTTQSSVYSIEEDSGNLYWTENNQVVKADVTDPANPTWTWTPPRQLDHIESLHVTDKWVFAGTSTVGIQGEKPEIYKLNKSGSLKETFEADNNQTEFTGLTFTDQINSCHSLVDCSEGVVLATTADRGSGTGMAVYKLDVRDLGRETEAGFGTSGSIGDLEDVGYNPVSGDVVAIASEDKTYDTVAFPAVASDFSWDYKTIKDLLVGGGWEEDLQLAENKNGDKYLHSFKAQTNSQDGTDFDQFIYIDKDLADSNPVQIESDTGGNNLTGNVTDVEVYQGDVFASTDSGELARYTVGYGNNLAVSETWIETGFGASATGEAFNGNFGYISTTDSTNGVQKVKIDGENQSLVDLSNPRFTSTNDGDLYVNINQGENANLSVETSDDSFVENITVDGYNGGTVSFSLNSGLWEATDNVSSKGIDEPHSYTLLLYDDYGKNRTVETNTGFMNPLKPSTGELKVNNKYVLPDSQIAFDWKVEEEYLKTVEIENKDMNGDLSVFSQEWTRTLKAPGSIGNKTYTATAEDQGGLQSTSSVEIQVTDDEDVLYEEKDDGFNIANVDGIGIVAIALLVLFLGIYLKSRKSNQQPARAGRGF